MLGGRATLRTKPPAGATLDRGHPSASGLAAAYLLNEGAGVKTADICGGTTATLVGTATWKAAPGRGGTGGGVRFTADTEYVSMGNPPLLELASGNYTALSVLARCVRPAVADRTREFVVAKDYDQGSRGFGIGLDNVGKFYLEVGGATRISGVGPTWAGDGAVHTIAATMSGTNWVGFVDGAVVGTFSGVGGALPANTVAPWRIGERAYTGVEDGFRGTVELVYVWRRCLSRQEMAAVTADPYGLVLPSVPRRAWAFVAVVATATGTAAASTTAATASAAGTFTAPTYTGTAAVSAEAATASAAGTHTQPTYSATAAVTTEVATASLAGTVSQPTYAGTAAVTTETATAALAGTHTQPTYSGTAAVTTETVTAALAGDAAQPVYAGTAALSTEAATAAADGTHTQPVYSGTAAVTAEVATASAAGQVIAYAGTAAVTTEVATASAAGDVAQPVYSATGAVATTAATASAAGDVSQPVYAGEAAVATSQATAAAAGTHTQPTYSGSAAVATETVTAVIDGTVSQPVYAATAAVSTEAATAALAGAHTARRTAARPP